MSAHPLSSFVEEGASTSSPVPRSRPPSVLETRRTRPSSIRSLDVYNARKAKSAPRDTQSLYARRPARRDRLNVPLDSLAIPTSSSSQDTKVDQTPPSASTPKSPLVEVTVPASSVEVDPTPPAAPVGSTNPLVQTLSRVSNVLVNPGTAPKRTTIRKRDFGFLPIPKSRRHDISMKPEDQFVFSWRLNLLFATMATVAVMNLYYIQPMLVKIAEDFDVDYDTVAKIPTLSQGGYGTGILFISTLGDLVRRRPLVLLLYFLACTLSIGLALARNVQMLEGLSFIVGMLTVTPQICIPWTADLAPSNRRARAMSITLSGLISGLVIGRVIGGIISNFASWRDTYWFAVGAQGVMLFVGWLGLPDTPDKDIGLSYFGVLASMGKFMMSYPTLTQACCMAFFTSSVFAGFWTSLTFLLSDAHYHYSSFTIGLLGLLGLVGAIMAPQWGRLVDKIVPWLGQLCGTLTSLISMIIALAGGSVSVGAICVSIVLYDCGQQLFQVSSSYRIAGIDPKARARLNGCYLLSVFAGQTSGTYILSTIYNHHGWHALAGTAVAFVFAGICILFLRGPYETRWIGWRGGFRHLLKRDKLTDLSPSAITEVVKGTKGKVMGELNSVVKAAEGRRNDPSVEEEDAVGESSDKALGDEKV